MAVKPRKDFGVFFGSQICMFRPTSKGKCYHQHFSPTLYHRLILLCSIESKHVFFLFSFHVSQFLFLILFFLLLTYLEGWLVTMAVLRAIV